MKRSYGVLVLAAVFAMGLLSVGCASNPQAQSPGALSDWTGTWNNFSSYFENPGIVKAYEILAEREGKTPDDIKARYAAGTMYQCDIAAIEIQGDDIIFYHKTQCVNGATSDIAYKARYAYEGEVSTQNAAGRVWKWKHFETSDNVPYQHFMMLPAEADIPGETMIHFHFRYGDNLDTLLAADGWFATMIAYDSTIDLLINHMTN
ncbi:MAG: metal-binding protein ZinT [Treponema sp.]|jgi:zinc transport system substrate-binding protein|nr:metal-binding protein ZinT [Treponema sp.]